MTTFDSFTSRLQPSFDTREAQSIARIVFEDCFGLQPPQFSRAQLTTAQNEQLQSILTALLAGQPLQYILGQADFYGLKFKVDPRVLIPRPETEELVEWVLETIGSRSPQQSPSVLDIGTGSGCIPITIAKKSPRTIVWGLDVSADALALADENANLNQVEIRWQEQDILNQEAWTSLPIFDLIISNPPYIPLREQVLMPAQVTQHEPHLALFVPDEDPLLFYRAIAAFAQIHLNPNGFLFFECNEYNALELKLLLESMAWSDVVLKEDLSGKLRMIRATR